MSATFTGPGGLDPLASFAQLRARAAVTVGDGIAAGQALRTAIRDDTAKGIDSEGNPFTAYTDNYAKQKEKRGRSTSVDLFGARQDSHMLNAILVRAGGAESAGNDIGSNYGTEPVNEIRLGIYAEDEAVRARVHNEGLGHQPRRHWFDANRARVQAMERGISERIDARLKA